MNVRAKFICVFIEDRPEYQQKDVSLSAVANDCEKNKSFSKYTPAGHLIMTISYEAPAVNAFEQGKEYYIDFSPAE